MSLILGGYGTRQKRTQGSSWGQLALTRGTGALTSLAASSQGLVGLLEGMLGVRIDPAPEYLFYVELSGVLVALFTECSGLSVSREVEEVQEGGVNHYVHKLPGRVKQSNIVLKRGLSLSRALWDWFSTGMYDFEVQRINFSIIQGAPGYNVATMIGGALGLPSAGGDAAQSAVSQAFGRGFGKAKHWNVEDAYPVKWEGPTLSTSSNKVGIEMVEIAHHGLDLGYEVGTPMNPLASMLGAVQTGIESATSEDQTPPVLTDELSSETP